MVDLGLQGFSVVYNTGLLSKQCLFNRIERLSLFGHWRDIAYSRSIECLVNKPKTQKMGIHSFPILAFRIKSELAIICAVEKCTLRDLPHFFVVNRWQLNSKQRFLRCFLALVGVTRQINKFKSNLTKLSCIGHLPASP